MILLRDAPRSFLVGMFFLLCETRFVRGARTACWLAFLRNDEGFCNELGKLALGYQAISRLASRVARYDAHRAIFAESGCELRQQTLPLLFGDCFRLFHVPCDRHTR